MVEIEFDPVKDMSNRQKHGLSFEDFKGFDGVMAVRIDNRNDYGEARFRGFGRIGGRGYCIVYTRRGDAARLISFRRAHDEEMSEYE